MRIAGSVTGPAHNDPHLTIASSGRDFAVPATNALLKRDIYDEQYPIIADLAKSWEVSKDGLTYTFKLQEGVKFHNLPPVSGREFTSEDAKYSLMRRMAHPDVVPEKDRPRFEARLEFGNVESFETPDKYTLVVKLKEPHAPFLDSVAHPGTAMLPRELVEQQQGIIRDRMIGTGPFELSGYRQAQNATYTRNPDYFKKGLPYLDAVEMITFADPAAGIAAFRARQLDIPGRGTITPSVLTALQRDMPDIKIKKTAKANIVTFRFSMKFEPFQDVKVRRAIHLAVDRQQFVELIAEGLGVVSGPVTPVFKDMANSEAWLLSQPGYRKDKAQDLAEAKRLMREAGYPDGFKFGVLVGAGGLSVDAATLLADQLKPLNITLKIEAEEYGVWINRSVKSDFDLSFMTHTMGTDVDSVLGTHIHTKGGRNYGKFSDPVLDDLIEKERRSVTAEDRRKWAQEAEKRAFDQAPVVFLYQLVENLITHPWVHNVSDGLLIADQIFSVEKAWIEKR